MNYVFSFVAAFEMAENLSTKLKTPNGILEFSTFLQKISSNTNLAQKKKFIKPI